MYPFIALVFSAAYLTLLLVYRYGWRSLPAFEAMPDFEPSVRITTLIPARNEAAGIEACLQSIVDGNYPPQLLEIVVIDDFSTDDTADRVRRFAQTQTGQQRADVRVLALSDYILPSERVTAYKKKALETGIAQAKGELMVATDADCIAPPEWLRLIAAAYETQKAQVIAGPVLFHREKNLLQRFQSLDFVGLMGITGAGIRLKFQRMGNGANIAYPKSVFETAGGFSGNENRASGDDMFLIQKIAALYPDRVFFLKNPDACVRTEAPASLSGFIQQRLRWGAKNAALPEWPVRLALALVFAQCALICAGVPAFALGVLPGWVLLAQLAFKAAADYLFLREMCTFFRRKDLLRWFWPSFFMHTLYIALIGAGSLFFKQYTWKGRRLQ